MNIIILFLFLLIIAIYAFKKYCKLHINHLLLPPLIPGKFLFGNYFDLIKEPIHLGLTRLGEKYQHVFRINIFGQNMVVLNSPESISSILSSKTLEFGDRPSCFLIRLATNNFKDLIFSSPNIQWLQIRNVFHKFFSDMKKLHDRKDITEIFFLEEWPNFYSIIENLSNNKETYEFKRLIHLFQSKLIAFILFGEEVSGDDQLLNDIRKLNIMSQEVISGLYHLMMNMNPFQTLFGTRNLSNLCNTLQFQKILMNKIFGKAFERSRKSTEFNQTENVCFNSIIDMLLPLLNLEKPIFDDVHLKNVLTELIFAGIEGVVSSVNSFIFYMSLNPTIQNKVFDEINQNVKSEYVLLSDKKKLVYTENCIYETLRLVSQIPLGIFRKTLIETKIFDYEIPKGTIIIPNLWKINHDENLYPAPFDFKPERFNDASKSEIIKNLYIFGSGKRGCPGKSVALNLIFLYVTNLIKNFEFKLAEQKSSDPRTFELNSSLDAGNYKILSFCRQPSSFTNLIQATSKKSEIKSLCINRCSLIKDIQENISLDTDEDL